MKALSIYKEQLFGAQRTEKWKTTLREATNLSGWNLRNVASGHQSIFLENIIKQVLQDVNQTPLDVAWNPIGVDTCIKDIELLLEHECVDEVHMVGIYGIGGIGKTTLAKGMYNRIFQQFGGSCFLSNVGSVAEAFNGLVKLKRNFIKFSKLKTSKFKVNSVSEGIKLIKEGSNCSG